MNCPYCRNEIQQGVSTCPECGNRLGGSFMTRNGEPNFAGAGTSGIPMIVTQASEIDRAEFIRRTYTHTAGAILLFIILESMLLNWSGAGDLVRLMMGGRFSWLIVLGAFIGVSYVADKWARSGATRGMQYAGLGLYTVAEAIIFLPLLYIAQYYSDPSIIGTAGLITLSLSAGLTFVVFTTKKDFTFLRSILGVGSFVAIGFIAASMIFGFTLGLFFSLIMVVFASGAILYNTSSIMRDYRTDQYVSASLTLFSSIMLLFWYILSILLNRRN